MSEQNISLPTVVIERRFTQVFPDPKAEDLNPRTLLDLGGSDVLVVLGDLGSGKTTAFRHAATEPGSQYRTVRHYRNDPQIAPIGTTLFLDGLDEQRAKTLEGGSVVDELCGLLTRNGRPKVRISCRSADWHGRSDLNALVELYAGASIRVVEIVPLEEDEILKIAGTRLADPAEFVAAAKKRDVLSLLQNPQTLELLIEVVGHGEWPSSRKELLELACSRLAVEVNEEHMRYAKPFLSQQAAFDASGFLCSIQLCADTLGFSLTAVDNADFPSIDELGGIAALYQQAARRRVFASAGSECVAPSHRTTAEYLAARYLAGLVSDGLPLGRVLSLLTGGDGGPLSELRGILGWLLTFLPHHAAQLVPIDPLGFVVYGDVGILPLPVRLRLLESLQQTAKQNPWFRGGHRAGHAFGRFAQADMESALRSYLQDRNLHPSFLMCILDIITFGEPLPNLTNPLLGIIRNPASLPYIREDALDALLNVTRGDKSALLALLDDICAGLLPDPEKELRGQLLKSLYPIHVTPTTIARYLPHLETSNLRALYWFLTTDLPDRTRTESIPALLDEIAKLSRPKKPDEEGPFGRLIGRLIVRALDEFGTRLPAKQIYGWFAQSSDEYGHSLLDSKERASAQAWLNRNPQTVFHIFDYWLQLPEVLQGKQFLFTLWQQLVDISPPPGFPAALLAKIPHLANQTVGERFLVEVARFTWWTDREDRISLEDLYEFVETNSTYRDFFYKVNVVDLEHSQLEHKRRMRARQSDAEKLKEKNREFFDANLPQIQTGTHMPALVNLARSYLGHFQDSDSTLPPRERLSKETSETIATAATEGFLCAIRIGKYPTAKEVGELDVKQRVQNSCWVLLAGLDVLNPKTVDELLSLPTETLACGIAMQLAHGDNPERQHAWFQLLLKEKPPVVASAFWEYVQPFLAARSSHIPSLWRLAHNPEYAAIGASLIPKLLREYPGALGTSLSDLLGWEVENGNRQECIQLVQGALHGGGSLDDNQRSLWLAAGLGCAPEEFSRELVAWSLNNERTEILLDFLAPDFSEKPGRIKLLADTFLSLLISLCARRFQPVALASSGSVGPAYQRASSIGTMIDVLADRVTETATVAIRELHADPELARWNDRLAHASANQMLKKREAEFIYPRVGDVVAVLNRGRPANIRDLQQIVVEHLQALKKEIRDGDTDFWKAFWNGTTPKIEDECRDRILEKLRSELSKLEIQAIREGHYAQHKRADIEVLTSEFDLPIEIKRHYHKELWTAAARQLVERYTTHPKAKGYGIYVVCWFGIHPGRRLVRPPDGSQVPRNPTELESRLQESIPPDSRHRVVALVLDMERAS